MQQNGEPSVEEILESIKKVIARDNRESAQSARERRGSTAAAPQMDEAELDDEVLELDETGMIEEFEEFEEETGQAIAAEPERLTTENAANAMRDSLAALAMIAEPSRPPQIVRTGETSLEALTRELLKPMLAQWLDANLPEIVERLVKKEIARIAGKKG